MGKKENFKRLAAGLFFLLGIVLLAGVVLIIGVEKGLTQPKFNIEVLFTRVDGLAVGAPIRFLGVNVGTVGAIDLLDEKINGRGVKVTLNVFRKYIVPLEKSTKFLIKTEGVLGIKLIEISSSERGPYMNLAQPVIGEDPIDVQDLVEIFTETANSFKDTSTAMNSVVAEFNDISDTVRRLMNRIEQKLIEGNLFKVF